jgi:hypothetical protein
MQTLQTNTNPRPSHAGKSKSPGMLVASHSIHHHNHHPDNRREVEETAEEMAEAEEEAVYLLQQDPACSHHMDEPQTLTSF